MQDGSRVILNTDSALRIAVTDRQRRIDLERGEAFFEVAPDPKRPFIVQVGHGRVIAVGTQFSVRREDDRTQVIVSEGTVRFENDNLARAGGSRDRAAANSSGLLLPAGTIARTQSDDVLVQQKPAAEIEQSLTWRSGLLTFRNTPLADAIAEFNRYNTRKIVIEDPSIAALEVGGIFRSTNLDTFVRLLEQGFHIHATVAGDRIVLTRN
jgi:transmembrane sensor